MILYFGNILSSSGNNPSFIELLGPKLNTMYPLIMASDKRNKLWRMMDMVWVFCKWSRKARVVLIDTYSYQGFYFAWIISLCCRLFSIPYIPIIRGGDFLHRLDKSPGLAGRFLQSASHVVAPSEYMVEMLAEANVKALCIPNFIETSHYPFKIRNRVRPKLLWVRSFHKIYNPLMAIEVVLLLKSYYQDVHLTMAGPDKDGSMSVCKNTIEMRNLESSITILGKLNKEEIREIAKQHDVFINTTTIDNHPVSVIEAMGLGLVIVSTNVGGMRYLIQDQINGILVPNNDAVTMVDAIVNLIENPALVSPLQINARKNIEEYDWQIVGKQWASLINPYFLM